jgi:excisionase family DNA binding protein
VTASIASRSVPVQDYFSPAEIAEILRLHPRTIVHWLKNPNHPLSGVKISNQWRVPRETFVAYLEIQYGHAR